MTAAAAAAGRQRQARWLGWWALSLGEAEVLKLWDIVEFGLGGYVIGRSAEKILPGVVSSVQKK